MKKVSLLNVVLGVAVGVTVLNLKADFLPYASPHDWKVFQERVIEHSNNNRKDKFFFVFKHYIFFVSKTEGAIVVRVFRIFGLPMMTCRCDLSGEACGTLTFDK